MNERIREIHARFGSELPDVELLCECGETACAERIVLPLQVYETVRGRADRFVVASGHEPDEHGVPVGGGNGYRVVERALLALPAA